MLHILFHASKISFAKCEILHVYTQTKLIKYFKSVLLTVSFEMNIRAKHLLYTLLFKIFSIT